MSDTFTLSLETVTRNGSFAVLRNEFVIAQKSGNENSSHSVVLLSDVDAVLRKAKLDLHEIKLIAVAAGPGSFTGLRTGLSTVQAWKNALKIPAIGISTLEALVYAKGLNGLNCAAFPAGRNEVFAQFFGIDNKSIEPMNEAVNVAFEDLLMQNAQKKRLNWIVPPQNQQRLNDFIKNNTVQKAVWTISEMPGNLAISVGELAYLKFQKENISDNLSAIYVRGADIGGKR